MLYELIILSFLARSPMHGYLIAKIINDIIGPYARLSSGRLYPLLAKLESDGLIVEADAESAMGAVAGAPGKRRQRAYAITEAGRQRFYDLMMDTTSNQGEYGRIFWFKLPSLYLLSLTERLYLLDHYITYCQTHIFHIQAEIEDLRRHAEEYWRAAPAQGEATLYTMEHLLLRWRTDLESARQWRARVVEQAEETTPGAASEGANSAQ